MSTPAIYKFAASNSSLAVAFYGHYDGYPEGAAERVKDAVIYENKRGGTPAAFMRANDDIEFAVANMYADFIYEIDVIAQTVVASNHGGATVFSGNIIDFIDKYAGVKLIFCRGAYMTRDMAVASIKECLDKACHSQGKGWTGNASSQVNDAWAVIVAYRKAYGDDADIYDALKEVERLDRLHCKAYRWATQMNKTEDEAYAQWVETFRK